MKERIVSYIVCIALFLPVAASAFEIEKTPLYVFLHESKPVEEEGAKALEDGDYALALRKYREALQKYEDIWKTFPDLANARPHGIDRMVDESIENCKKIIEDIKEAGEGQDEFYQKLAKPVRVNFTHEHIRDVAKALTFLTDVNIIVDETVFNTPGTTLNPYVTLKTEEAWPLKTILTRLCRQSGLAFSIEADYVFISTRVKLDKTK